MSIQAFIKGIVLAEQSGQDIEGLVATLANMPNVDAIGANGAPQPYGESAIRELIAKGREAALAALEKDKRKRERAALEAAQNALRSEAEGFVFPSDLDVDTLRSLFERVKAADAYLTLSVDGEKVSLSVNGLRALPGFGTDSAADDLSSWGSRGSAGTARSGDVGAGRTSGNRPSGPTDGQR